MRADVSVSLWVLCRLLNLYYHVILCFLGKLRIMPRHYMWSSFCFLCLCDFIIWAVSCCKKWPTTFLIMLFHIMLQHSKSPKCLLFLKKKKRLNEVYSISRWTATFLYTVASEWLSCRESFISRQVLFKGNAFPGLGNESGLMWRVVQ